MRPIVDYTLFAEKCVAESKVLQNKLQEDYDLGWHENWFYDHVIGLLTFSTQDKEVHFKYFLVGTFSNNTNTWRWAWDNENTLDRVKEKSIVVRDFGHLSKFDKLTTGYFASNETEAWEFAAIAAKLTNGIGIYRPVNEHLLIFLVITEFVDADRAQEIEDKYVDCGIHDKQRIAYVCTHLNKKTKVGFEEAFETTRDMELEDDEDFQAWCSECEKVRQREGEWNETSMAFADIKIVCEECFFEIKELNLASQA